MRAFMFILLFCTTEICSADQVRYASLESYISTLKEFSGSDLSRSIVDIDGNNQADILGLLKNGEKAKIFILVKTAGGEYELSGASRIFDFQTNFNGWINPPEKEGKNIFSITMILHSGNVTLKQCKFIFTKQSLKWEFETNFSKDKNSLEQFNFEVPCEFSEIGS